MSITSIEDLEKAYRGEPIEDGDASTEGEDSNESEEVESTEAVDEIPAPVETTSEVASEGVTAQEEPTEQVSETSSDETETPAYVPNLTYKVRDQEKTFDERFVDFIKSEEDEKYLRDLYTRADGLDTYKEKLGATEGTIAQLQGHLSQATDYYKTLATAAESNDMERIANTLGLKEDAILEYALRLAEESEMPEEKRREVKETRELRYKTEAIEAQNAALAKQIEEFNQNNLQQQETELISQQANMVNTSIERHSDLNGRLTEAGINLFDLVVAEGHQEYLTTGQEPSDIDGLVDRVVGRFSKLMPAQEAAPAAIPQANTIKQEPRPAAIPKITGDPASPIDRRVSSIDQLKAEYEKQYGQPSFY